MCVCGHLFETFIINLCFHILLFESVVGYKEFYLPAFHIHILLLLVTPKVTCDKFFYQKLVKKDKKSSSLGINLESCLKKMTETLYDLYQVEEQKRIESDIIYNILISRDTTLLDKLLSEILSESKQSHPGLSKRFDQITSRCLSDNSRVAKHGLFFFGLYLCPKFAESMVKPEPKLNPFKFKKFYETVLPKYFNQLLNGEITSLQKFVEEVRAEYIMCGI